MVTANRTILHQYRVTFLRWLIPLFFVLGCLLVALSLGFPLLLDLPSEPGLWVAAGLGLCGGLAMPVGSILLWLLIPALTTFYDPARGIVALEAQRPLWHSTSEFPVANIADVGLVAMGDEAYSLALMLKSGKKVRIDYSSTSNASELEAQAARIRAAIGVGPTATGPI